MKSREHKKTRRHWSSHLQWLLLVLILCSAFWLRARGLDWPRLHPDEAPVSRWIARGGPDRVYPGGFFQLIKPFRIAYEKSLLAGKHWQNFLSPDTDSLPPSPDYIILGRWFNVLLGTANVWLIYLLAARLSRSRTGGLVAAALAAGMQISVEHAHYAETDIAMVFMLSAALLVWLIDSDRPRMSTLLASGFLLGFAAGTKFTLIILLLPFLGYTLFRRTGSIRLRLTSVLIATLLFMVGLIAASPDILDWNSFSAGLQHESARLAKETSTNLGAYAGDQKIRILDHAQSLAYFATTLGTGWLILILAALPMLVLRRPRREWWLTLALPGMYMIYWFFMAPWVREQEFLNFLPLAAACAALPVIWLWRRPQKTLRLLALILMVWAVGETALRAQRNSSIFAWPDLRECAGDWLQRHEPDPVRYAKENYADVHTSGETFRIQSIARNGLDTVRQYGANYLLRVTDGAGRGMRDPLTDELYEPYALQLDYFEDNTTLLKRWQRLTPKSTWTTFNSVNLDLYGLRPIMDTTDLPLLLARPAYYQERGVATQFSGAPNLGGGTVYPVDHHRRVVALGSGDEWSQPVYAIFNTRERPARIHLKAFGQRHTLSLAPYETAVVPLDRSSWKPRTDQLEKLVYEAAYRKNIEIIPCYLRIAFNANEAARVLDQLGELDQAWALFGADITDPIRAFRAAVAAGDLVAAEKLYANVDRYLAKSDPANPVLSILSIDGLNGHYYQQFSRIRLPEKILNNTDLCILQPDGNGMWTAEANLPFIIPGGPSTLEIDWSIEGDAGQTSVVQVHQAGDGRLLEERTCTLGAPLKSKWAFQAQDDEHLRLRFISDRPGRIQCHAAELRWGLRARLAWMRIQTTISLAKYALEQQDLETARALARRLTQHNFPGIALEARQIAFAAAEDDQARLHAARILLQRAPLHAEALRVLEGSLPTAEQEPGEPVLFHPGVALLGTRTSNDGLICTVQSRSNRLPPLRIGLFDNKGKCRYQGPELPYPFTRGETVDLTLPANSPSKDLSPGFESAVRWYPGALAEK